MRNKLTLTHLETFVEVARELSFRKASENLFISQPALSRAIQSAEEAFGARLFDRDTRNVRLTPAGEQFFPIANRLLHEFQNSIDEVSQYLDGSRGQVTIASLPSIGYALLTDAITDFSRHWPNVKVTVTSPHHSVVTDLVLDGVVDFGLSMKPIKTPGLEYLELCEDEFVLVCNKTHPLAQKSFANWEDFSHYPYIDRSPTTSMHMLATEVFRKLKIHIEPAHQIGGLELTGRLLQNGLGITALPRFVLPLLGTPDLRAIPLTSPELKRHLGVLMHRNRTRSMAAQNFLTTLVRHAKILKQNVSQDGK